jgi:hypothetical protein
VVEIERISNIHTDFGVRGILFNLSSHHRFALIETEKNALFECQWRRFSPKHSMCLCVWCEENDLLRKVQQQ